MNRPQPLEKVFCRRNRRSIQTKFFLYFCRQTETDNTKRHCCLNFSASNNRAKTIDHLKLDRVKKLEKEADEFEVTLNSSASF